MGFVVEKEFVYADLPCIVTFNDMGFRCGYVGVPTKHPWYGKNYDDLTKIDKRFLVGQPIGDRGILTALKFAMNDERKEAAIDEIINVHGSLTYSGSGHPVDDEYWYFGFDCGHYGDASDIKSMHEYFPERAAFIEQFGYFTDGEIRTLDYCIEQCISLAEQLNVYFN